MKISRLRLLGFKSFVEPTELLIEPGLTGVVGPNGCGKSNLLEALRWVMGETSHKSMRAAAMDDVIFSGTTHRPARHFAEVTLFLDNTERQAPGEFNDRDQIEITRRIEREAGSSYRINAREARARDIKLLFEDAATGARSPALVRQGQISEIVNAKPEQRRRILEDAAGIAGLHSRRHEAELRLKAAEANLARVADVLGQVTSQMESLKRQARQARRYKEISDEIRRSEALLLHLAWSDAQRAVETEEVGLETSLARLAELMSGEAGAIVEETRRADAMAPLRDAEARRAAALHRLKIEAETFEREVARAVERQRELEARAAQLETDLVREDALAAEARELLARLADEAAELESLDSVSDDAESEARETHERSTELLAAAEATLADVQLRAAEARAGRRSLETGVAERRSHRERTERQLAALESQAREISARAPDARQLTDTTTLGQQLAAELLEIEDATLEAERKALRLAEEVKVKRAEAETARLAAKALSTERETLARLLVPAQSSGLPGIVDQLRVSSGYETALGAALGEDLEAPAIDEPQDGDGEPVAVHWRLIETTSADPRLPVEAEPLSKHVKGPAELTRRLRQVGVVPRDLGARLQAHLKTGQRLVSREGDLWRWDGFVAAAHGTTAAAQRLAQKNRLASIEYEEAQATEAAEMIAEAEATAAEELAEAQSEERQLRQTWRATQARLAETRERLTRIEQAARETEARYAAVSEARERAQDDLAEAIERETELQAALDDLSPNDAIDAELAAARTATDRCRADVTTTAATLAEQQRTRRARAERAAAIATERDRWISRQAAAERQTASLRQRAEVSRTELAALAEMPAGLEERRDTLFSAIADAEAERQRAADTLVQAEADLKAAQQALRAVQSAVSDSREARARIEARLEAARQRRQEEARRIRETLGVVPEGCLPLAGLDPQQPLPGMPDVDRQLTRLRSDRDRLGGVNLQAEEELEALTGQFSTLETERADVEQAVAKLRGAIGQINREAKKRLGEAFDTVDGHFRRLFTTLFGGGEARLEMVEGEDPLQGGLEIIAKPPGKKPATLSLLSGGEQTLTALSLIFAVFLTNPSPICVLDEVDAPLDDANVDRFCTLMEKMAAETATRFLVITHHPMTMARMNRLFGVTMAERGVSQLVSVDLETAARFLEAV
ncbi:MAG: chromosome segregation protein SMC [Hyphomicrobiaceae bacterium]|nr:chromosome segregation protein SMC [Hyphomicrobiaceae bacterium]